MYISHYCWNRERGATYAEETRHLFMTLMEAILESLGIVGGKEEEKEGEGEGNEILKELGDGSQMRITTRHAQSRS